jgi:hypothetical protein
MNLAFCPKRLNLNCELFADPSTPSKNNSKLGPKTKGTI